MAIAQLQTESLCLEEPSRVDGRNIIRQESGTKFSQSTLHFRGNLSRSELPVPAIFACAASLRETYFLAVKTCTRGTPPDTQRTAKRPALDRK
jgi:hypothetical protein